jgi:hypothetical protein
MTFWLGTHRPNWLGLTDVPLFVSRRTLAPRRTFPRARGVWALDSGGFSELSLFGEWQTSPRQYVAEVRRFRDELGGMAWAAIQDHMCEPFILAKTGRALWQHQLSTVVSWMTLNDLDPTLPWLPVLQGWHLRDYVACAELYWRLAGTDLRNLPLVGLGSVCRRQGTAEAEAIVRELTGLGIRLHGFGFKTLGLARVAAVIGSADSLAWSFTARRRPPLAGCPHANCANCLRYALAWRVRLLARLAEPRQEVLFP